MHFLLITPSYKPAYIYGGPTISVSKLCEALSQYADAATLNVLTTTANGKEEVQVKPREETDVDGVRVTYCSRLTKDHTHFSPSLLWSLYKQLSNNTKCSVVHIHAWWNLVSVGAALVCRVKGVKPIISPRGMLGGYTSSHKNSFVKKSFHQLIGKKLLSGTIFHVTSEKEMLEVRKQFPNAKAYIIPNIIDLPDTLPEQKNDKVGSLHICFLGRINPVKGLELLFRALQGFDKPYQLSIAGNGDQEYIMALKSLSEKLRISRQINWLGHLDNEDKFNFLADADLLVLPSYTENFANVVIESLSVGTPVLLSDQVGTACFVQQHDLGWVCPPNADEIHAALEKAYADKAKRERIRQEAPGIIRKEFLPEILVQKYLEMYGEVSGRY